MALNPNLKSAGKVRESNPYVIELGPSAFYSEVELANTIAHEVNHARDFIKGGDAPESRAYPAWVWCGSCKEYSHSRHVVPAWWINMDSIELSQLHARPDNLNDIKEIIDKWVNECVSKTAGEKTIVD